MVSVGEPISERGGLSLVRGEGCDWNVNVEDGGDVVDGGVCVDL